jgi:type VI secretion system protein VasG
MSELNIKALVEKLNKTCHKSLQLAANLCLSNTHYEVDLEHFFIKLLEIPKTDFHSIMTHFSIDSNKILADLTKVMETFKTGNSRTPLISPRIAKILSDAWYISSIEFNENTIRSGFLILAICNNDEIFEMLASGSILWRQLKKETITEQFYQITSQSIENKLSADSPKIESETKRAIDQYTINLTQRAREKELDPVFEREEEIKQIIDILIRRRQNNPILTGEAGVGKTAVVEGFAIIIIEKDVPEILQNVELLTLDMGLLQAGAGIKGEFENRLKAVIKDVKSSPVPIILFIDEAHTIIGAGGPQGSNDAANLLKPSLARGELRTIAATTWSEYKKYFEKDAALARRFQVIKVDEPDEEKCLHMMRAIAPKLEQHHQVFISDKAIHASVKLSRRYITSRYLPDKAVSVLDTACSRIALSKSSTPPEIEFLKREESRIQKEMELLKRDSLMGNIQDDRIQFLLSESASIRKKLEHLTEQWENELKLSSKIIQIKQQLIDDLNAHSLTQEIESQLQKELESKETALKKIQNNLPLVHTEVNEQTICEIISDWTGIPTGRMLIDDIKKILNLKNVLSQRVIGQDHAMDIISQMIQTSHAGIEDPSKPTGVFLLVGPSGVGKTETALALAEQLYGGEETMISINMSEYQEAHSVSGLKGSPPGYVGYGEGGVLTEAVRKRPYSVVLLDEIEKSHPDVSDLFYQVFDKGVLEDGEGRCIDFKNTLIVLTSNIATDLISKLCADEETIPDVHALTEMLKPELKKFFKPAFLGRLKVVPYYPISQSNMNKIVHLKLNQIIKRIKQNKNIALSFDDDVISTIVERCTDVESGARNIDHILTNTLLPEISTIILNKMAEGKSVQSISVSYEKNDFVIKTNEI